MTMDAEKYKHIPLRILENLEAYKKSQSPHPGGFLTAVLENNLVEAVHRADSDSLKALPAIVAYVWEELPGNSWGTPEKVEKWLERCVE
jgi:hypothetical protein